MARPLSPTDPSLVLQPQLNQGPRAGILQVSDPSEGQKMWGQTQGNWNVPVDLWPAGTGNKAQARCRQDGNWGILLLRPKGTKAFPAENSPEMKGNCGIISGWSEPGPVGLPASHLTQSKGFNSAAELNPNFTELSLAGVSHSSLWSRF